MRIHKKSGNMASLEVIHDSIQDVCKHIKSVRTMQALSMTSSWMNSEIKKFHQNLIEATIDIDSSDYESTINFLSSFSPNLKNFILIGGNNKNKITSLSSNPLNYIISRIAKIWGNSLESIKRPGQLSTNFNSSLTRSTIKTLSCHASRLKRLNGFVLNDLDDEHAVALAKGCSHLENLNFSRIENFNLLYPLVSSWGINQTCNYLSNLSEIDFSFCSIDDEMIDLVAKSTTNRLKHIHLMGCWTLSGSSITSIATYCKELETISLFEMDGCKDDDIIALSRGCKKLIALDLGSCIDLTDHAFIHGVSKLEHLSDLSVFHCMITNKGLEALSNGCPKLKSLDLTSCRCLTASNNGIMSILKNAKWASIIGDIDFSELLIFDDTIQAALEAFPALHTLRLANCPNLSEKSIEFISESQRHRCNSNNNKGEKKELSSSSSSLLSTSPSSVSELSGIIASVEAVAPATPLKALDLSCCCGIPDAETLLIKEGLVDLIMIEQL